MPWPSDGGVGGDSCRCGRSGNLHLRRFTTVWGEGELKTCIFIDREGTQMEYQRWRVRDEYTRCGQVVNVKSGSANDGG